MILGEAVTKIANRYGYDAFDNLDEIRDDDLKEAVETVFLARRCQLPPIKIGGL